jgi:hypothetical protein
VRRDAARKTKPSPAVLKWVAEFRKNRRRGKERFLEKSRLGCRNALAWDRIGWVLGWAILGVGGKLGAQVGNLESLVRNLP